MALIDVTIRFFFFFFFAEELFSPIAMWQKDIHPRKEASKQYTVIIYINCAAQSLTLTLK